MALPSYEKQKNEIKTEIFKKIGLGEEYLPRISEKDVNSIELNGFAYAASCNYGGATLNNGYLLQLTYTNVYKIQFFIAATGSGALQYRKNVNGTWQNWSNV